MDLKQMQYFTACAQTGSFSEAAKVLYSTQPSVSKVVKALEDSLGMQLFERLPRGIRLTPQGREVYRYACKIVNDMKKLENMAEYRMANGFVFLPIPVPGLQPGLLNFTMKTMKKIIIFRFIRQASVQ